MFFAYLRRGFAAGLVAGLAFGLFVAVLANPLVAHTDALAHGETIEGGGEGADHHQEAGHDAHHESAVSAAVTGAVSAASGLLWGLLLGAVVFGIAFYFLEPLLPGAGGVKSYVLAGAGFVTVSGAPWLVLPPVPPGIEQGLPTDVRLAWYAGMMLAGAVTCGLAVSVHRRLRETRERTLAAVAALVPFALLAVPVAVAPANPLTGSVPADLAAAFRGLTVLGQVGLWVVLAGTHAWLRRRGEGGTSDVEPRAADPGIPAD